MFVAGVLFAGAAGAGILEEFGAKGPISRRFGNAEPPQGRVIVIGNQPYLVPADTEQRPAVDPRTGAVYPDVGGGAINPRTGEFYPRVGGGNIDPKTGQFFPN